MSYSIWKHSWLMLTMWRTWSCKSAQHCCSFDPSFLSGIWIARASNAPPARNLICTNYLKSRFAYLQNGFALVTYEGVCHDVRTWHTFPAKCLRMSLHIFPADMSICETCAGPNIAFLLQATTNSLIGFRIGFLECCVFEFPFRVFCLVLFLAGGGA